MKNLRTRLTVLSLFWFLWDVKEPTLLFVKSRGRKPRWCGTTFHGLGGKLMGLISIGTLALFYPVSPSWAILANSIQNCNDTENRINIFQRCHSLICSSPSPLSTKGTLNAHKSTHPTQLRRGSLVIIHRFMWSKPSTGLAFMTLLTVSLTVEDEKNYLAMNIKIKNNFWLKHIKAQNHFCPVLGDLYKKSGYPCAYVWRNPGEFGIFIPYLLKIICYGAIFEANLQRFKFNLGIFLKV